MEEDTIRIGQAANILGVTPQTLRNWEKSGRLRAERTAGGQRFYAAADIARLAVDLARLGWAWSASAQPPLLPPDYYCERSDRFTSRLVKMGAVLQPTLGVDSIGLVSLLTLVTGEIGDNSFAHNLGNWPDVPGIFYGYDERKRIIVLADRGQGVRATLQRVRPTIASDVEALRIAFTEIISGRDPEKRGNGLKVIREIAETKSIGLIFRSGLGEVRIPKEPGPMKIAMAAENVRGAYAVISF
ncbi:MAG: MerR family DNA-binding transcriptional regulator [Parcubacteria group bacterium]